jgi:hypothetical protein
MMFRKLFIKRRTIAAIPTIILSGPIYETDLQAIKDKATVAMSGILRGVEETPQSSGVTVDEVCLYVHLFVYIRKRISYNLFCLHVLRKHIHSANTNTVMTDVNMNIFDDDSWLTITQYSCIPPSPQG